MTSPSVNSPDGIRRRIESGDKNIHIEINVRAGVALKVAEFLEAQRKGHDVSIVESSKEYTTTEAAKLLGISRVHLRRMIDEGKVRSDKVGSHHRITAREIESQQAMKKLREIHKLKGSQRSGTRWALTTKC